MATVYCGGVSPEGELLIKKAIGSVYYDLQVRPIAASGAVARVQSGIKSAEVLHIFIDDDIAAAIRARKAEMLNDPKIVRYEDDEKLRAYLMENYGTVGDVGASAGAGVGVGAGAGEVERLRAEIEVLKNGRGVDDNVVKNLRDELSRKDLQIASLQSRIDSGGDTAEYISTIKALRGEKNDLEERIAELEKTSRELENAEKRVRELETERSSLKQRIKELDAQAESDTELTEKLAAKESEVAGLAVTIENLRAELASAGTENDERLERMREERDRAVGELSGVTAERDRAVGELSGVTAERDRVAGELSGVTAERDRIAGKLAKLEERLSGVTAEHSAELSAELDKERAKAAVELERVKQGYITEIERLQKAIDTTGEESDVHARELSAKLNETEAEIERLSGVVAELEGVAAERDRVVGELSGVTAERDRVTDELVGVVAERDRVTAERDRVVSELSGVTAERDRVTTERDELRGTKAELEKKIREGEQALRRMENENKAKQAGTDEKLKGYEIVIAENKKKLEGYAAKVRTLEDTYADYDDVKEERNSLENDVAELHIEVERLKGKLDVAKAASLEDAGVTDELRAEVADLKRQLENAGNGGDTEALEIEIATLEAELEEIRGGVFVRLGEAMKIKKPLKMTVDLRQPKFMSKFLVCVAGSGGSIETMYDVIKKTCVANPTKRVLLIDLSNDTFVDVEFRLQTPGSPVNWLLGEESFKKFCVNSGVPNTLVKVLTTGLSYVNPVALLAEDWDARLSELDGSADVVILLLGDLNNIVSKILFNTFAKVMPGHIIVNASPVNLRTCLMHVIGMCVYDDTVVDCARLDVNGQSIYNQLRGRIGVNILRGDGGIAL